MKQHLYTAWQVLLGVGAVIVGFGIVIFTVKICWTIVEFIFALW